ncbi:acyl carrier protein [Leptospira noguchii]|uniref:acyl carrier protein n=1 Tax=Leptospira noguchii TaxID=28182 RepID=UPI00036FD739|nr:acyl carrier protein [Leptospira noguchii]
MKFTDAEEKLTQFFVEREGNGILEEIREIDFIETGIIDSLDLVSLAVFIEQNFGKKIDLTNPATFSAARRFDTLMKLITN